jgi:hypothetical protein
MNMVKVPTMHRITELGKDAVVAGIAGGAAMALGYKLMGPLGAALGAVGAGAMVGGVPGTVIAVSGVSNSMATWITGLIEGVFGGGAGAGSSEVI